MIRVDVVTTEAGAKEFVVRLADHVASRRDLSQALADRFREELVDHFRRKNETPNRLGGRRTNFWAGVADDTQVAEVREDGATVAIGGDGGQRIRIHIYGGDIVPKVKKALTIPLVAEAHGIRAAEYEQRTGRNLFPVKGKSALFEERPDGGVRAVYALRKRVTIPRDPEALPDDEVLKSALTEEANDWMALVEGGLA